MIVIKETKHCDSRAVDNPEDLTKEAVEHDTELHIEAVRKCGAFICDKIKEQFKEHDHTKLGDDLPDFIDAMKAHLNGKSFKDQPWWKVHLTERHHLNDRVPDDVNLIDVLELICDCISAGMARTGEVYDLKISDEVLQKAFQNTAEMIKKEIKVVSDDDDETYDEAYVDKMKAIFGLKEDKEND